jgi:hypothetical protein
LVIETILQRRIQTIHHQILTLTDLLQEDTLQSGLGMIMVMNTMEGMKEGAIRQSIMMGLVAMDLLEEEDLHLDLLRAVTGMIIHAHTVGLQEVVVMKEGMVEETKEGTAAAQGNLNFHAVYYYRMNDKDTEEMKAKSSTIWIGNLPYGYTEEEVTEMFDKFGRLLKVTVPMDKYTGKNKGFAFIEFESRKEAEEAFEHFLGANVEGRKLRVDWDIGMQSKEKKFNVPAPQPEV